MSQKFDGDLGGYYDGANDRIFSKVLPRAKHILDVGCAAGALGEKLRRADPRREVWGVEFVKEVAEIAAQKLSRVIEGDIETMRPLPFPKSYFDCVIFGDVLEHLKEPESLLLRLREHFAPNGVLIVSVPNVAHWSVQMELLQGRFTYEDSGLLDRTHLRIFTPGSFAEMLARCGYFVIQQESFEFSSPICESIADFAQSLGINRDTALKVSKVYQEVFVAAQILTR